MALCYVVHFFFTYMKQLFWQRGSVHSYVPAVQHTQLCGSRPSYWEQTSPAGLNTCTESLENVVKPYLDTRLADSDELNCVIECFLILKCWKLARLQTSLPSESYCTCTVATCKSRLPRCCTVSVQEWQGKRQPPVHAQNI